MLRRVLLLILSLLLGGYVLLAGYLYRDDRRVQRCSQPEVIVLDSLEHPLVHSAEIRQLMWLNRLRFDSVRVVNLDLEKIEHVVEQHPLVKKAEASVNPAGYLRVEVQQRRPMVRVIPREGQRYFIDSDGLVLNRFTSRSGVVAIDVPVATGWVNAGDSLTNAHLYDLALHLEKDVFWDNMIEQVVVESDGTWTLWPRVGDFSISLGKPVSLDDKLAALKTFYTDALPRMGWDTYSHLNLAFDHQIVCTKRNK